jgi:hypothetical protein
MCSPLPRLKQPARLPRRVTKNTSTARFLNREVNSRVSRGAVQSLCRIKVREPSTYRLLQETALLQHVPSQPPQHLRAGGLKPLELSRSIEGLEQPRVAPNLDLDAMPLDARFLGWAWGDGLAAFHADRGITPTRPWSNSS